MKKLLVAAAALVVAVTAAHAQAYNETDGWGEDVKEWECSLPRQSGTADRDRDRVYKTELFITYGGENNMRMFNVRHTTASGAAYDRSAQYTSITTRNITNRNGGVQMWTGYYTKNPARKIVGELRYTNPQHAEGSPKGVYTEYHYDGGRLHTTVVHQCHWVGPGC
jgi:hypothetical protein